MKASQQDAPQGRHGGKWLKRVVTAIVAIPVIIGLLTFVWLTKVLAVVALLFGAYEHALLRSTALNRLFASKSKSDELDRSTISLLTNSQLPLLASCIVVAIPLLTHLPYPTISFSVATQVAFLCLPFAYIIKYALFHELALRGGKRDEHQQQQQQQQQNGGTSNGGRGLPPYSLDLPYVLSQSGLDLLFLAQYALPMAFAIMMRHLREGMGFVMVWILCTFQSDNGGLLLGITMGRTRVLPTLSPNKSVEGILGSIGMSVLSGWLLHVMAQQWWTFSCLPSCALRDYLAIAALVSVVGIVGDLLESAMKRAAAVKDSSNLLPGHGGFLDRMDSLLVGAPAAYFYIITFVEPPT